MFLTEQQVTDLTSVSAPFGAARTPPGWWFTDPAVHRFDADSALGRMWLCVGHVSQFEAIGDYRTLDIGSLAVIVVRSGAEQFTALRNSCRHRGTRLLDGRGRIDSRIRCPYHAWSYTLDGELAAVPNPSGLTRPADDDLALGRVALERWHGWLFVAVEPTTSLAEQLADFPGLPCLAASRLLEVAARDYQVACDWKLLIENFNECYHCRWAHPELYERSRGVGYREYPHRGRVFTGGPMSLEPGVRSLADPYSFIEPGLTGWQTADSRMVFYFCLFPNFLLTIAPDYVMTHTVWPTVKGHSRVATHWFVTPEQRAHAAFTIDPAITFWDRTNHQDFALCENAQRGVAAAGHRPGPYHDWELCVHDFDRWYAERLLTLGSR